MVMSKSKSYFTYKGEVFSVHNNNVVSSVIFPRFDCMMSLSNVIVAEIDALPLHYDVRASSSLCDAVGRRHALRIRAMDMLVVLFPVKDAEGCTFPVPSRDDLKVAYLVIKEELSI